MLDFRVIAFYRFMQMSFGANYIYAYYAVKNRRRYSGIQKHFIVFEIGWAFRQSQYTNCKVLLKYYDHVL